MVPVRRTVAGVAGPLFDAVLAAACAPAQTLFSSYFRAMGGVQYLEGGVASGFNHVEHDVYEPTLLHIKGRRNTRTKQVPVHVSSLNQGDAFILDLGLKLFLVGLTASGGPSSRVRVCMRVCLCVRVSCHIWPPSVPRDSAALYCCTVGWQLCKHVREVQGSGGDGEDPEHTRRTA